MLLKIETNHCQWLSATRVPSRFLSPEDRLHHREFHRNPMIWSASVRGLSVCFSPGIWSPDSLPLSCSPYRSICRSSLSTPLFKDVPVCPLGLWRRCWAGVTLSLSLSLTKTCQLHASKRCCFWEEEDAIDRHVTEEIVCVCILKNTHDRSLRKGASQWVKARPKWQLEMAESLE